MSDDIALRAKARELIRAGALPDRRPDWIRGGAGFGGRCALCGAAVRRNEIVLEVEVRRDDGAAATHPHLHIRCFLLLDLELQSLEAAGRASASDAPAQPGTAVSAADGSGCRDAT
jgi:hypothetical protein